MASSEVRSPPTNARLQTEYLIITFFCRHSQPSVCYSIPIHANSWQCLTRNTSCSTTIFGCLCTLPKCGINNSDLIQTPSKQTIRISFSTEGGDDWCQFAISILWHCEINAWLFVFHGPVVVATGVSSCLHYTCYQLPHCSSFWSWFFTVEPASSKSQPPCCTALSPHSARPSQQQTLSFSRAKLLKPLSIVKPTGKEWFRRMQRLLSDNMPFLYYQKAEEHSWTNSTSPNQEIASGKSCRVG